METIAEAGVGRPCRVENLERDEAVELLVAGFVDLTHAARAERADDRVRTKPVAGGKRHC
jgi:hypothetical protein